jgi:O-antigen ligase
MACGLLAIYHVHVLHYPRAGDTYINPIEFGDTCTQLALISLCGTQVALQHPRRIPCLWFLITGFTLGVVGSVLSGTRGAWLAGLITLTFLGWWYVGRHSKRLLALVVLAVGLTAALLAQYAPVAERLQTMRQEINNYQQQGNAASSVGARMQMWQFASALAQQRPLLGWAQKGYDAERTRQLEQNQLDPLLANFNHPHNDYLDAAAKRGLLGLLILLTCHFTCFWYFWRAARATPGDLPPQARAERLTLCAVGMMVPLLFASFGLTDTHITSSRTVVMYFCLAAFLMAMLERRSAPQATDATAPLPATAKAAIIP